MREKQRKSQPSEYVSQPIHQINTISIDVSITHKSGCPAKIISNIIMKPLFGRDFSNSPLSCIP